MSASVELSDAAMARLQAEADRRGITVEALVGQLADGLPDTDVSTPKRLRFFAAGRSTSGRTARDVDEMLSEGFGLQ